MLFKLLLLLLFHIPAQLFVFHYNFFSLVYLLGGRRNPSIFFLVGAASNCVCCQRSQIFTVRHRIPYTRRGGENLGPSLLLSGGRALSSLFCLCLLAGIYGGKQVALHVLYKYIISKQSPAGEISLSSLRNVFLIKMLIACRLDDAHRRFIKGVSAYHLHTH